MERKEYIRVIELKELWEVFVTRLVLIVLVAVISTTGFFVFDRIHYTPEYKSTATLYILRQSDEVSSSEAANDLNAALKVVNDCTHLIKSHTVLDQVIVDLDLDITYKTLFNSVSTENPDNTRILQVTVKSHSPEDAKRIVDRICELGSEAITEAMGFEQVNLFEYGVLEKNPCNKTGFISFALMGALCAAATYVVYVIIYLLDDTLRTTEDIERYLGLSVLGEIPDSKEKGKSRKGYTYYAYTSRAKTVKKEGIKWKKSN